MASGANPVQSKVLPPAIALMVVGGLNILGALYFIFNGLFTSTQGGQIAAANPQLAKGDQEMVAKMMAVGGTFYVILGVVALLLSGAIIFGGLKMKDQQSYGLAMTASILAMIPCLSPSACCAVGLGIGIWSLVILLQPDVKASFR